MFNRKIKTYDPYDFKNPLPDEVNFPKFPVGIIAWFVFCGLLGVGLTGVIVWAIIRLVLAFT